MAPKISASTAIMKTVSSKFSFEICCSNSKDVPIGECISSPTFSAGGYEWALDYFPQGDDPENAGSHSSLFLILQSEANNITVPYSLQLLDKKGNLLVDCKDEVATFVRRGSKWGYHKFITRDDTEHLYCKEGNLVIICSINVLTEPKAVRNYPGGMCEDIHNLLKNGERIDVTFNVEGEIIPAHKFMLAARSPVFAAELYGPMAEAKMDPIKIDEMKAEVFKAILHFIYTDKLPAEAFCDDGTPRIELLHSLFVAADRYDLGKLRLMCVEQLERNLSVDTVVTTLLLADRHTQNKLKHKCLKFASSLENFRHVALTNEYLQILQGPPTLLDEFRKMVNKRSSRDAKTRSTG